MEIDVTELTQIQLNDLIDRAETRRRELVKENVQKVREEIVGILNKHSLTVEDLFGVRHVLKKRRPVQQKFRNPANHAETWSGRGKRPHWFRAELASGKKKSELLIPV